jgi:Thioredoxin like C-terminal domain
VRAWAEKYKNQGLVVIGVHAPEFAFEKDLDNVRRAAKNMRIDYPIAIDNDHAIWHAFKNEYWPTLYFVDAQGHIRHHQFGEGEYEHSEKMIQQLLAEAGIGGVGHELVSVEARGAEAAADWDNLQSPENYVGYARTENFASPGGAVLDKRRVYAVPAPLKLNHWALSGDWTVEKQATILNKANGRIAYRFHARDLHLVMGPAARGTSVRFRVFIDGRPPGTAHGIDVDDQGSGTVSEQRLYQLIRQPKPIADRQFEIEFLDSGVEAFVRLIHGRGYSPDHSEDGGIRYDSPQLHRVFGILSVVLQRLRDGGLEFCDRLNPSICTRFIRQQNINVKTLAVLAEVPTRWFWGLLHMSARNEPCEFSEIFVAEIDPSNTVRLLTEVVDQHLAGTRECSEVPASRIVWAPPENHGISAKFGQHVVVSELADEEVQPL